MPKFKALVKNRILCRFIIVSGARMFGARMLVTQKGCAIPRHVRKCSRHCCSTTETSRSLLFYYTLSSPTITTISYLHYSSPASSLTCRHTHQPVIKRPYRGSSLLSRSSLSPHKDYPNGLALVQPQIAE